MTLAISSYERTALADDAGLLNLAWTLDERGLLAVDLAQIIVSELGDEVRERLPFVDSYFVGDPYGERTLKPAVATFFQNLGDRYSVTAGAGINSLLHALAGLGSGRRAYVVGEVYPDFPHWIGQGGGTCIAAPEAREIGEHLDAVRRTGASVILIDRPDLSSKSVSLAELREFCDGAARSGALVLIDESYANYHTPDYSAANIVSEVGNLAVLRGFSKAYWLGGLRLAYCVASSAVTDLIRAAVPPMLASSLSLRIGRKILALGDIAGPLRMRIQEAKSEVEMMFKTSGLFKTMPSYHAVPYLFLAGGEDDITRSLDRCGIVAKRQPIWAGSTQGITYRYRVSVPLDCERMKLLRCKLKTQAVLS